MGSDIAVSKYGANTLAAAQKNLQQMRLSSVSNKINTGVHNASTAVDTASVTNSAVGGTVGKLSKVKDSLDKGADTLQAASDGLSDVGKLLDKAKKLAESSKGASAEDRAKNAEAFNDIRKQIDKVSGKSGSNGTNLLQGDDLTVQTGTDKTSTQTVKGSNVTADGLGVSAAQNGFASDDDIEKALADLKGGTDKKGAISQVKDLQAATGQKLDEMQARSSFTKDMISALSSASKFSFSDLNDQSASLMASQMRQQLGASTLSLANQAPQALMSLFS